MSRWIDPSEIRVAIRGWRDRDTGTIHLRACPEFEQLDADRIEDVVWWSHKRYERLCSWCFTLHERERG